MIIITYTGSFKLIAIISLDTSKTNIATLSLTLAAYPIPTEGRVVKYFFAKMTAKDDSTISCSHLVAESTLVLTSLFLYYGLAELETESVIRLIASTL